MKALKRLLRGRRVGSKASLQYSELSTVEKMHPPLNANVFGMVKTDALEMTPVLTNSSTNSVRMVAAAFSAMTFLSFVLTLSRKSNSARLAS